MILGFILGATSGVALVVVLLFKAAGYAVARGLNW